MSCKLINPSGSILYILGQGSWQLDQFVSTEVCNTLKLLTLNGSEYPEASFPYLQGDRQEKTFPKNQGDQITVLHRIIKKGCSTFTSHGKVEKAAFLETFFNQLLA